MDYTGSSRDAQHLCVLVHGLWGNPVHLESVAKSLRAKHSEDTLHILVAKRNSGSFTYDGIELGGERVTAEIEEEVEKLAREGQVITRFSIVGYSLGGLVARYSVGLLDSKGFFDKIKPVNITTFASPHLGVRTPLKGSLNHIWNVLGARTLSTSGRQLFTIDKFRDTGRPLLEILADPESIFLKGLAKFERRTLYSNIVNDRSAVYYTTGIASTDPFSNPDNVKINYVEGYEDVVLDRHNPVSPLDKSSLHANTSFMASTKNTLGNIPLFAALVVFIPFGVVAFLLNSAVQTVRSSKRIRLHEQGLAGIQPNDYRFPLLINSMRETVEDVYENLNATQDNEYLNTPSDSDSEEASASSPLIRERTKSFHSEIADPEKSGVIAPTLALAPYQFKMIEALDKVGWRKYPVFIHKVRHSHAAIIVRVDKPSFDEGRIVLKHWLDEEFIL
ncbi:hypothetical protein BCON_0034g00360 [Botryotinia convoluta]|uniref:DUF676 domain-containing protein n=1 Tax=Botryotinia convoluta TaxID=54673 RepID=A0A4Z1IMZ2_9HELO|nr:hypothetical protein BCON_0034g00360 [Botryotinia convoluta]